MNNHPDPIFVGGVAQW